MRYSRESAFNSSCNMLYMYYNLQLLFDGTGLKYKFMTVLPCVATMFIVRPKIFHINQKKSEKKYLDHLFYINVFWMI
jgi:hypothetical protein